MRFDAGEGLTVLPSPAAANQVPARDAFGRTLAEAQAGDHAGLRLRVREARAPAVWAEGFTARWCIPVGCILTAALLPFCDTVLKRGPVDYAGRDLGHLLPFAIAAFPLVFCLPRLVILSIARRIARARAVRLGIPSNLYPVELNGAGRRASWALTPAGMRVERPLVPPSACQATSLALPPSKHTSASGIRVRGGLLDVVFSLPEAAARPFPVEPGAA